MIYIRTFIIMVFVNGSHGRWRTIGCKCYANWGGFSWVFDFSAIGLFFLTDWHLCCRLTLKRCILLQKPTRTWSYFIHGSTAFFMVATCILSGYYVRASNLWCKLRFEMLMHDYIGTNSLGVVLGNHLKSCLNIKQIKSGPFFKLHQIE